MLKSRCAAKKKFLESGIKNECSICHLGPTWLEKLLVLELDHINGNNKDNDFSNLRLLCPNCHSQAPTSNKRKSVPVFSSKKIKEFDVIKLAKEGKNIRQILFALNCSDTGSNYGVIKRILKSAGIEYQHGIKVKSLGFNKPRFHKRKVKWPLKNELDELTDKYNVVEISKFFGVSDVMVHKWIKLYGIKKKSAEYRAKRANGFSEEDSLISDKKPVDPLYFEKILNKKKEAILLLKTTNLSLRKISEQTKLDRRAVADLAFYYIYFLKFHYRSIV